MKKVRTIINMVLGSVIAALGFNACGNGDVTCEYGVPIEKYGCPIDTTVLGIDEEEPLELDVQTEIND